MSLSKNRNKQQIVEQIALSTDRSSSFPRRKFLTGLLAGAGTLALSACGGGGDDAASLSATANDASVANRVSSSNLAVTAPVANASVSGTVTVTGTAGSKWLTVAVLDHATGAKIGPDTTPRSGAFSIAVDTTKLAAGSHTFDVTASSVAAGKTGGTKATTSVTVTVAQKQSSSTGGTPLFYGMNGHIAYPDGIYHTVSAAAQLAMLKDLGVTNYRVDVAGDDMAATVAKALTGPFAGSGVSITPVINPEGYDQTASESAAYAFGFNVGVQVTKPLKGLIKYIECGNELDSNGLINGDGSNTSDYDPAIWPAFRGVTRGMIDGVKSIDPSIKCGVNVGIPLAYRALQMLWNGIEPNGTANGRSGAQVLRWDFTTFHWYESSGDITCGWRNNACVNVLQILKDSFGLPIWLTEWGWSGAADSASQASAYVSQALQEYRSLKDQYNIQSVMMYSLMDPDYGLLQPDGKTKKPAYTTFKNFTAANPV